MQNIWDGMRPVYDRFVKRIFHYKISWKFNKYKTKSQEESLKIFEKTFNWKSAFDH